jgi:hypothetical protein
MSQYPPKTMGVNKIFVANVVIAAVKGGRTQNYKSILKGHLGFNERAPREDRFVVLTSNALVEGQKLGCIGQRDRCVRNAARFTGVQT